MLLRQLTRVLLENIDNYHVDNHDFEKDRNPRERRGLINRVKFFVVKRLNKIGFVHFNRRTRYIPTAFNRLSNCFDDLEALYSHLSDGRSKELLVHLLAYYILGKYKVKLPRNASEYWSSLNSIKAIADYGNVIRPPNWNRDLLFFDLEGIGFPLKLYFTPKGILNDFVLKQYEYPALGGQRIKAELGDVVIDAGGCFGDTALYFATQVGTSGKVFVFEFIPSNIEIALRNFDLNPLASDVLQLVSNPLWDRPQVPFYYLDNGPASKVTMTANAEGTMVLSESIDNFVSKEGIEEVHFIKMDIEGAEMPALRGAINTIRRFKPKLAISVYHNISDLCEVPKFIKSIDPRYKLYLDHFTIHKGETILFAAIDVHGNNNPAHGC